MAQRPERLSEQTSLRRVVHVDVVSVREPELHVAERIIGAGRLHKAVAADIDVTPVDRIWIYLTAVQRGLQFVGVEHARAAAPAAAE